MFITIYFIPTDGHLGYVQFFAIINTAMNTIVYVSLYICQIMSLEQIPRSSLISFEAFVYFLLTCFHLTHPLIN